jgi:CMP-N-acetylneuraminic acid synthetase
MKLENISGLVIIPAKTDSTRLKKKNLRVIDGKTLLEHAIEYSMNSKLVKYIVVTSESKDVQKIVEKYSNILFFSRDQSFMGEREVADVYVNVIQEDLQKYDKDIIDNITHIIGVQPDHPDRETNIDQLLEYAVNNKYDDLVTVDSQGTRNGAVRVVKKEFVQSGMMSRRVGSFLDNCTNIHSEQDLIDAENNIRNRR